MPWRDVGMMYQMPWRDVGMMYQCLGVGSVVPHGTHTNESTKYNKYRYRGAPKALGGGGVAWRPHTLAPMARSMAGTTWGVTWGVTWG
eukprot:6688193-Prymnesium_polylepis.1